MFPVRVKRASSVHKTQRPPAIFVISYEEKIRKVEWLLVASRLQRLDALEDKETSVEQSAEL